MVSIAFIIPIVIVALVILIVAGTRGNVEGDGDQVIKNVYIYLVLFATLMMTIGGSVAAFMAAADLFAPAPYYQTFEEYKRWGVEKDYVEDGSIIENSKLTDEELMVRYDALVKAEESRQIVRAKNSLIKSFGWIIIPLPVFLFFQRRLLKKKSEF